MSTNSYQLYQEMNRRLAVTIVIKSALTAHFRNERLTSQFGATAVNPDDMTTWQYYMHVAGEYHPTDTKMYVKSWDTTEIILFSKENLAVHRATARAYAYGSKQFWTLVERFPDQDLLIMGILYPADKIKAIEAEDHTVIAYPPELIEDNEYSLVSRISDFCKNTMHRWFNRQYCISDNLYAASAYAMMYMQLYLAICNFRLEACKTAEAHSFHIGQYLTSYGVPEDVLPMLTKKQALFLYRNIKYIRVHPGKNDTFEWLIENLFTERNLPICKYTMRHFDTDQQETLYPTVRFKSLDLNKITSDSSGDLVTTETILEKEKDLGLVNREYMEDNLNSIDFKFATATSNVVQTKVLESALTDYSSATFTDINQLFMSYWPYLAKLGKLLYYVKFTNSRTGESSMISAEDAFILTVYAGAMALGYEMIKVPPFFCERVIRWPSPELAEYQSMGTSITDAEINKARSVLPVIDGFVSIDSFNAFCRQVQKAEFKLEKMIASQGTHFRRAEMKAVAFRSFTDTWVDLESTGVPYSDWLRARNINLESYQRYDYATLFTELFRTSVGADIVVSPNLAEVQQAMSSLLTTFSSYSIQLVGYVNSSNVVDLKRPALRANVTDTKMDLSVEVGASLIRTSSVGLSSDYILSEQLAAPKNEMSVEYSQNHHVSMTVGLDISLSHRSSAIHRASVERASPRLLSFEIVEI